MTWLYVIAGVDVLMFALIGWMCHRAPVREDLEPAVRDEARS